MNVQETIQGLTPEERERFERELGAAFAEHVADGRAFPRGMGEPILERIIAERPKPVPDYAPWQPESNGDAYFVISDYGLHEIRGWKGGFHDRQRLIFGNVFSTVDAANREARETAAWRRLKQLARMMNVVAEDEGKRWVPDQELTNSTPPRALPLGAIGFYRREDANRARKILWEEGHLEHLNLEAKP